MNFKALIAAAAVTLTGVIVAPEAKADTCFSFMNGMLCNENVSNTYSQQVYHAVFENGTLEESFTITCDGRRIISYHSYGNMSQTQSDYFAREFCALPN